jgi:hypothetical protein
VDLLMDIDTYFSQPESKIAGKPVEKLLAAGE